MDNGPHLLTMRTRAIFISLVTAVALTNGAAVDFGRDVFPILQRSCFECHGSDVRKSGLRLDTAAGVADGGSGGAIIRAGNPDASELIRRVTLPSGDSERMPKRGDALTKDEIRLLREWIDAGAVWPESFTAPKHWAYVAPRKAPLPPVKGEQRVRNEIDRFVLARLEASGMTFSPEADRATQLRRLSLDLTGLPPAPEEIDAFLKDRSKGAYEAAVDRLLASAEFGPRWAQPWLDYARYADSHGFQRDNFRDIWAYRDWVIDALNRDMPFDRFSIEQLAGDLIPNATEAQRTASGFNQNAPTNVEAGTEPEETRVNQIFDRINTLGTVWLGTTFECAQCHDHKYDPFSMRDYYGMFAFFNGTEKEAERTNPDSPGSIQFTGTYMDLSDPETATKRDALTARVTELKMRVKARTRELAKADPEWEAALRAKAAEAAREQVLQLKEITVTSEAEWEIQEDGSVLFTGNVPDKDDYTLVAETDLTNISGLKVEFLADDSLPAKGPARGNGNKPNVVLNDFSVSLSSVTSGERAGVKVVDVAADFSQGNWNVKRLLDNDPETGWAIAPRFGESHWFTAEFSRPVSHPGGTRMEVKLIQQYGGGRVAGRVRLSAITGSLSADKVSDAILAILETPRARRAREQVLALRKYRTENDALLRELNAEIAAKEKESKALTSPRTLVMREMERPRESFLFKRGNYTQPGDPIEPRVPAVLHPLQDRHFRHGGSQIETPNRLVMAQWLMDRENPVAARAAVNRLWQELFGRGIVTTPEDFGVKGDAPTHPGLLDWLAVAFMEDDGWSLKRTLKRIVLSATYRQSSRSTPRLLELDPSNALLSRGPRFRLTAEQIRDNALAIAGLLSTSKGGEPIKPPQPDGVWSKVGGTNYKYETSPGEQRYRRGVYVVWKRGAPYPSFVNFDANNRMACRVQRPRSNTPLQALTLMNDPVYVEAAMAFARRLLTELPSGDADDRIHRAFRIALARDAKPVEKEALRALLREQSRAARQDAAGTKAFIGDFRLPEGTAPDEFAGWYAVATALLNYDETITKG